MHNGEWQHLYRTSLSILKSVWECHILRARSQQCDVKCSTGMCVYFTFFTPHSWSTGLLGGSQLKDHMPVSAGSRKILSLVAYYTMIISKKPWSITPGENGKNSYHIATQKAFELFVLWGENFLIISSKSLLQRFSTIKMSINYAAWSRLVYRVPLKNYAILGCQHCICKWLNCMRNTV